MNQKQIELFLRQHHTKLNIDPETQDVEVLTGGENHHNIRVEKIVLRYSRLGRDEHELLNESRALKLVPQNIAPQFYLLDKSKKSFNQTVLVIEFVQGRHKKRWSDNDLRSLAKTLRKTHTITRSRAGKLTKKGTRSINLAKQFEQNIKDVLARASKQSELLQLLSKVRDCVLRNQELVSNLREFSLVHTDCHKENILFHKQELRIIDWEWAAFGDPAADYAAIGFAPRGISPWYVPMPPSRLETFVKASGMSSPSFLKRVHLWRLINEYHNSLYFCSPQELKKKTGEDLKAQKKYLKEVKTALPRMLHMLS